MSWIRFDGDCCKESSWFTGLTDGQRWAYLAFVHYSSAKPRGFVKKMPLELLTRRIEADMDNLRDMLDSAQKWINPATGEPDPKIVDRGDKWEVMDYPKFNPPREDKTHADRQRRYKERRVPTKRPKEVTRVTHGDASGDGEVRTGDGVTAASNGATSHDRNLPSDGDLSHAEVTRVTHGDARRRPTITNTSTSALSIKDALSDGDTGRGAKAACEVWNEMVSELKTQNPNCRVKPVKFLTDKRQRHAEARLAQKDFDMAALCGKIRGSPYLRGEKGNWVVSFDWIVQSPNNWPKIVEGRYDDEPVPATGKRREYDKEGMCLDTR